MPQEAPAVDRRRVALYGAAGLATAALAASAFLISRAMSASQAISILAALPPSILLGVIGWAARFPCRAMPLRRTSTTRIVATHIATAAVASGIWVAAWQSWLGTFSRATSIAIVLDFSLLFGLGALLYLMAVAMHYLLLEVEAAQEAEETALRYQVLAREAELKAFKAQVDPHFLFNSLNAVASLCGSRPQDARQMSQLLADFFRQTLRLGGLDRITLAEEIDLVARYLAIEKIRFGDRLSVRITVADEVANAVVPPLLLQPLVENAVRHGIASVLQGGTVDVSAATHDGAVRIIVQNPADEDRTDAGGEGIGLANVRGRLNAFFGGAARLRTSESEGRYRVEVDLPR